MDAPNFAASLSSGTYLEERRKDGRKDIKEGRKERGMQDAKEGRKEERKDECKGMNE
jgi:hypothetical protein